MRVYIFIEINLFQLGVSKMVVDGDLIPTSGAELIRRYAHIPIMLGVAKSEWAHKKSKKKNSSNLFLKFLFTNNYKLLFYDREKKMKIFNEWTHFFLFDNIKTFSNQSFQKKKQKFQ